MSIGQMQQGDDSPSSKADVHLQMDPAILDRAIRQSVQHCWLSLPPERRTHEELSVEMRRILDRALHDFQRDLHRYGADS